MPEDDRSCVNCYLMAIGEVDSNVERCVQCGKPPSNPLLDTF